MTQYGDAVYWAVCSELTSAMEAGRVLTGEPPSAFSIRCLARDLQCDETVESAAMSIMSVLWPVGGPTDEWIDTELGRYVMARYSGRDGQVISRKAACSVLGITMSTLKTLLATGKLDSGESGGVTQESVARYFRARRPRRQPEVVAQ